MRLPGWQSKSLVAKIHSWLEVIGLGAFAVAVTFEGFGLSRSSVAAFALMVVAEAARYTYGQRETKLSDRELDELRKQLDRSNQRQLYTEEQVRNIRSPRKLSDESKQEIVWLLEQSPGTRIDLFVFDSHLYEVQRLSEELKEAFTAANADCRLWKELGERLPGPGVCFATSADASPHVRWIAGLLNGAVHKSNIDCMFRAYGFHRGWCPLPLPTEEKGTRKWSPSEEAWIRVQISEKQVTPIREQIG